MAVAISPPFDVSYHNIVFHRFENGESNTRKCGFAGIFKSLLSFEEKFCWKFSFVEGRVRWARSVQTVVSTIQSGNFDLRNQEHGKPTKKFEDAELHALIDGDNSQTNKQPPEQLNVIQVGIPLCLKAMGKVQKCGKWCHFFFHRLVTGEKCICFENPTLKKSWIDPREPSTSTTRLNCFRRKVMLCLW